MAGSLAKSPPTLIANRIDHGHPDNFLQPFQVANDNSPVGPWTGPGNVQMISSGLRRKAGPTVRCNPFSKYVLLSNEPTLLGLFIRELRIWDLGHDWDTTAPISKMRFRTQNSGVRSQKEDARASACRPR